MYLYSVPRLYCVDCAVTTYFYFSLSLMGIMVLLLFNISEQCCWRAAEWLKFDVLYVCKAFRLWCGAIAIRFLVYI